jgi:light-regulated signal transduction histidine kinase (bacteriophytochrome)
MFVGTVRDITERKKAQKKMNDYIAALKHSNQDLDDFAYIASHDLKEPLRGLANNALFLKEDYENSLDEGAIKRIDRMIYLCERMEKLINDLLNFSKLGNQTLATKTINLNDVIEDVLSMMESTLIDENVKILIPEKMPNITCNELSMTEVFRNLITNAIKYNDKKEKCVEIGFKPSDLDHEINKHTLYVKDNGIGIDKEHYYDIFRIFKRLNDESDAVKGTGVGLTFVKKIIERHSGKIWIESEINSGTTFYFTIGDYNT